ncbi:MAG TPA: hypothetical protein VGG34_10015 [Opitutaceae bacterium]|jgi:hypothetical protein
MKLPPISSLKIAAVAIALCATARAQGPEVPDWALPGSATHRQVPPPKGFHRATRTVDSPLGIFQGQSDIGGALVPGSDSLDQAAGRYTINSAGYNIWYNRDEFRYLWTRMSGDASLAATITYPNPRGYFDRKVVLVVRQDLDDDSKEAMVALHGGGLIHLAGRPAKNEDLKEAFRTRPAGPDDAPTVMPRRIGIEKRGDTFSLYVSMDGEPLHRIGTPLHLHFSGPYYIGVGFCSHKPATSDTAVVSDIVLENKAGAVR